MNRVLSILLLAIIAAGLVLVNPANRKLVELRRDLGITQADPEINAPPLVVFTTVALGGFRGIIADILWMRSAKLQQEGKFFELVQLADWITKLEPRFSEVWAYHAWNLSYNVSVLFSDPADRWRWVRHGFSLLRDEGLLYNPNDPNLLVELGWIFQHKMGGSSDDAHMYYNEAWAAEMEDLLGGPHPDYDRLPDAKREKLVREYKLDPSRMQAIERRYGPLDWRMPQAHAIYWAVKSLEYSRGRDFIFGERMVYQSMAAAYRQGTLIRGTDNQLIPYPDFALFDGVVSAHRHAMELFGDIQGPAGSLINFLTEAVFINYLHGRDEEANRILLMLKDFRDDIPDNIRVEDVAIGTYLKMQPGDPEQQRTAAAVSAEEQSAYFAAIGDKARANGYAKLAGLLQALNTD